MKAILKSEQEAMESVWRQRAVRLSCRSVSVAQNEFPVMVLEIGDERYGVETADVAEILPPVQVTPVPGAPVWMAGIVNVRGEIRPVADLKLLLGIESAAHGDLARVVLLHKQGRELGLIVDRVQQIRSVASGRLQAPGDRVSDPFARYLKGLEHDTLMLLNTDALFAELLKETTS